MKSIVSFSEIEKITQGDRKAMKDLLQVFIRQNLENINHLKQNFLDADWDALKKTAHKLKSSLALVGLHQHRSMSEELERIAGNDTAATKKMVDELTSATLQAVDEMNARLKTL